MRHLTAVALAGALMSSTRPVPSAVVPGPQPMTFVSSWDASTQPYNLYVPEAITGDRPLPLVVVLHGKGATWQSWFEATEVCAWAEREGFVVAAPHGRGDWFYLGPGERDVLDVIEEVKRLCPVDPDRVFLVGHSMGGWGAWHLGLTHPDLFAGIVPMSAWAPLELLPNARHLAPFVVHGDADTVVPPQQSRAAVARLGELGIAHAYVEHIGSGHGSSMISAALPAIADWIRGRRRAERSALLTLRAFSPRRGRMQWLTLLETREFPRLAAIDARVADGDQVQLTTFNVARFCLDPARAPLAGRALRAVIDGQVLTCSPAAEDQVFLFTHTAAGWELAAVPRAEIPAPASPPAGHLEEPLTPVTRWMGGVLAEATGADTALLVPDWVAPELRAGDVTGDDLIDCFFHPSDQLFRIELSAGELAAMLAREDLVPPWWQRPVLAPDVDLSDPGRRVTAVVPLVLAERLPCRLEPAKLRLREVLWDHVRGAGGL